MHAAAPGHLIPCKNSFVYFIFPPALLRYNCHTTLCRFKVCTVVHFSGPLFFVKGYEEVG